MAVNGKLFSSLLSLQGFTYRQVCGWTNLIDDNDTYILVTSSVKDSNVMFYCSALSPFTELKMYWLKTVRFLKTNLVHIDS